MIPSIAHFVWYGSKLPYLHALAIRSAATHGGFESVRLHHTDPLDELPHVVALHDLPSFELVPLDDRTLCEEASGSLLADLIGQLQFGPNGVGLSRWRRLSRHGYAHDPLV